MRASHARPAFCFLIVTIAAVVSLAAPIAQTQRLDAATLRSEMTRLQQEERSLSDLRADFEAFLSPDVILVPSVFGVPAAVPLARFTEVATRWALFGLDARRTPLSSDTVSQRVAIAVAVSNQIKQEIRQNGFSTIDRDLSRIRQNLSQIAQQLAAADRPPVPGRVQNAPPTDAGEGWVLERALAGLNDGARAQVLSQTATAAGGDVTIRNQVTATCAETWHMSWTFSPDLKFVYQGVRIRTTLTTELVGPGCNYRVGSYTAIGEGTAMERFVSEQVPYDRTESGVIESQNLPRAQLSSADPMTSVTTTGELIVRRQPVRWPSYAVLRIYAYVPLTNLTIAYVFRAN